MIGNFLKRIYYRKYTKTSYSISNVDLIIDRMFANKTKGNFIDLGCNHPIKFNNTYLLYKRGWRGLNIDLDQTSINEFNKIRNLDFNVKALVSNSSNEIKKIYYYHKRSAINTVSEKLIKHRNSKSEDYQIIEQKTKTLEEIINNSPLKNKTSKIELLLQFLVELEKGINDLTEGKKLQIIKKWSSNTDMFEKSISINTGNGKISGIAKKIDSEGALIIKTKNETRRIFVGDVVLR